MPLANRIFRLLFNKYVLALAVACVWMLFFDSYNLLAQFQRRGLIGTLEADKQFYEKEIVRLSQEEELLRNDPREIERLARERYLMKRPNEDVFVVSERGQ